MLARSESKTVLIVDDEARLRKALAHSLGEAGYKTLTAASCEEALLLVAEGRVGLVITDLMMPEMDGMSLVRRLAVVASEVKVIIVTAYGSSESMQEAQALGVSSYLAKPFNLSQLKSTVSALLGGQCDAEPSSGLAAVEVKISRGHRALCLACSSAGRGLGTVTVASRRALAYGMSGFVLQPVVGVTVAIFRMWCGPGPSQEVTGQ